MADDPTVSTPPAVESPAPARKRRTAIWLLLGIAATLVGAATATMGIISLPSLSDATKTVDLVNLVAKANVAQQALATELNEITMAGVTGREPDEELTNKALEDLEKAGSPLLSSLPLPADEFGRRAEALLDDAQARLDRARYFSGRGYNADDKDVVQFTTLIEDVDTIVEKIPQDTPDEDIKNDLQEYLTQIRGLPVPVIAEGIEDNRGIRIQELLDQAKGSVGGPRTVVFVYFGLAGLFAVMAAVWYVVYALRRRTASTVPATPRAPKAAKAPKTPKAPKKAKESTAVEAAPVEVSATTPRPPGAGPSSPAGRPASPAARPPLVPAASSTPGASSAQAAPGTPKTPAIPSAAPRGAGGRPGVPTSASAAGKGTGGPASSTTPSTPRAPGAPGGLKPVPATPPRPSGALPAARPGFARGSASAPPPSTPAPAAPSPGAPAPGDADETKPAAPKAPGPRIPWRTTKPNGGGSPS
ncbi:MAG: hypothetical protein LBK59_06840 [Bifidobacteriaceae bacterium]|jgi:hypothetical protein|nr:hypothetical protein [Bifidobacteriaceae bacterium]